MSSSPVMIRLLSASVAAANRAGQICRDILNSGKLGTVDKVSSYIVYFTIQKINIVGCFRVVMTHRLKQIERLKDVLLVL